MSAVSVSDAGLDSGGSIARLAIQPLIALVLVEHVILYVLVADLSDSARVSLNFTTLGNLTWEHILLTGAATIIVLAIALPLGVLLTRRRARKAAPVVTAIANLGQAAPSIGLLVLLAMLAGTGFWTAVIALAAYGILPALSNTITGLQQVDPKLVEAGRGMGMTAMGVLFRVEVPVALPVILAGVRLALVLLIGTATLATFIGAGGLGQLITTGVNLQLMPVLIVGAVLVAALALIVDWAGRMVELRAQRRGR